MRFRSPDAALANIHTDIRTERTAATIPNHADAAL